MGGSGLSRCASASGTRSESSAARSNVAGTRSDYVGTQLQSAFDGRDWKFFYTASSHYEGPYALLVQDLDPATLECSICPIAIVSADTVSVEDVVLAYNGECHLIAWIEHIGNRRDLRLARMLPDFTILDPGGRLIASGVCAGSISVAAGVGSGMLGWIDQSGTLFSLPLDAQGLPAGAPAVLTTGILTYHAWLDLAPLGENWLIAWTSAGEGVNVARLASDGTLLPPGIGEIPAQDCRWGVSVASSGSMGLLCWRSGWWQPLRAVRIGLDGTVLDPTPIPICDSEHFYMGYGEDPLRRNLDCIWTGEQFVIVWNDYETPPPKRSGGREDDHVWAQWLQPDGHLAYSNPIEITRGSRPSRIVSEFVGRRLVNAIADDLNANSLFLILTDSAAAPVRPPWTIETGAAEGTLAGLESRPAPGGAIVSFTVNTIDPTEYGVQRSCTVHGCELNFQGSLLGGGTVDVSGDDEYATSPRSDVWGVPFFFAYERQPYQLPCELHACIQDGAEWIVAPGGFEARHPTAIGQGMRYLLLWDEIRTGFSCLYKAWLDPAHPVNPVVGSPVYDWPGSQQTEPFLVAGPGELLCVFSMVSPEAGSTWHIYALRLAGDGTPLDPAPVRVADQEADLFHPRAVWDGYNFVITWQAQDGKSTVHAARMTAAGQLLDGSGITLGSNDTVWGYARLSTNRAGLVAVSYGSCFLRVIDDAPPAAVDRPDRLDPAGPVRLVCFPSPSRGPMRIELRGSVPGARFVDQGKGAGVRLDVLDALGRRVRSIEPSGPGSWRWDGCLNNGKPAPAGMYSLRPADSGPHAGGRAWIVR